MNANNGMIYDRGFSETPEQMAQRVNCKVSDLIEIKRHADTTCKKCNGRGSIKRGFFSKRYKPCECVL